MDLRLIKFGEGPFQYRPLMKLFNNDKNKSSFSKLQERWERFSYNVGLTNLEVVNIRRELNAGHFTMEDVFREIFSAWQHDHEEDAHLKNLYDALVFDKLKDLAESVKSEFCETFASTVTNPASPDSSSVMPASTSSTGGSSDLVQTLGAVVPAPSLDSSSIPMTTSTTNSEESASPIAPPADLQLQSDPSTAFPDLWSVPPPSTSDEESVKSVPPPSNHQVDPDPPTDPLPKKIKSYKQALLENDNSNGERPVNHGLKDFKVALNPIKINVLDVKLRKDSSGDGSAPVVKIEPGTSTGTEETVTYAGVIRRRKKQTSLPTVNAGNHDSCNVAENRAMDIDSGSPVDRSENVVHPGNGAAPLIDIEADNEKMKADANVVLQRKKGSSLPTVDTQDQNNRNVYENPVLEINSGSPEDREGSAVDSEDKPARVVEIEPGPEKTKLVNDVTHRRKKKKVSFHPSVNTEYLRIRNVVENRGSDIASLNDRNGTVPPPSMDANDQDSNSNSDENRGSDNDSVKINVSKPKEKQNLLRAILKGESVSHIKNLLDGGADANEESVGRKFNAMHIAIHSVLVGVEKKRQKRALEIMKLLMRKEYNFKLINEASTDLQTPLLYSMRIDNLDTEILTFFHSHGADFNALDKEGDSVLLNAISKYQDVKVIKEVLEYSGNNLEHCSSDGLNALIVSARNGHASALEFFMDKLDVNSQDNYGFTALHWLFNYENPELDYEKCLELLLLKNANFTMRSNAPNKFYPLLDWIEHSNQDPYPALVKLKDQLPISKEIASTVLTLIVKKPKSPDHFLKYSVNTDGFNDNLNPAFIKFMEFLVDEKEGKLLLIQNEKPKIVWSDIGLKDKEKLGEILIDAEFLKTLGKRVIWNKRPRATDLGKLVSVYPCLAFESVLVSMLSCNKLEEFIALCLILGKLCRTDFV